MLSKALTETFKAKPLEPRKYFAQYLLNYAAQKRKESEVSYLDNRYIITVSLILKFYYVVCREQPSSKSSETRKEAMLSV